MKQNEKGLTHHVGPPGSSVNGVGRTAPAVSLESQHFTAANIYLHVHFVFPFFPSSVTHWQTEYILCGFKIDVNLIGV